MSENAPCRPILQAPCAACRSVGLCFTQLLACRPYVQYIRTGFYDASAPREPSRASFKEVHES